jgi:hypothetical protein
VTEFFCRITDIDAVLVSFHVPLSSWVPLSTAHIAKLNFGVPLIIRAMENLAKLLKEKEKLLVRVDDLY